MALQDTGYKKQDSRYRMQEAPGGGQAQILLANLDAYHKKEEQ